MRTKSLPKRSWKMHSSLIVILLLCLFQIKSVYAWDMDGDSSAFDSHIGIDPSAVGTKQISAINLLLPLSTCPDCRKVREEIYATNGCYQWENSHPNLIQMTDAQGQHLGTKTESNHCMNRVWLEPHTLKASKTLVWITARDQSKYKLEMFLDLPIGTLP